MEGAGWRERHDRSSTLAQTTLELLNRDLEQRGGCVNLVLGEGPRGSHGGTWGGRVVATVQGPHKITRHARRWHEVGPGPVSI